MQKIVYTRPDGGVSIITPIIMRNDPSGFTEEMALKRALGKDVPKNATNVHVVDADSIPTDRSSRDAWTHTEGRIET